MSREKNVVDFYVLCNTLKNVVRSGWKIWNVKKERLESIAEHIFGTQMLAISMWSEYDYDIDIKKVLTMLAVHETEEIIIGDNVKELKSSAFNNCSGLASVTIGKGVSIPSLSHRVFGNCTSLTSFKIPNSVSFIGWEAFYGCTGLKNIEIPNSVTEIGVEAFAECGADEIVLCDIYPARETNIYGVSSDMLAEKIAAAGKKCSVIHTFEETAEYADRISGKEDMILVMGAGDVIKVAEMIGEKNR